MLRRWLLLSLGELNGVPLEFLEGIIGKVVKAVIGKLVDVHCEVEERRTSLPLQ
jgi:hypothetical protein